ncbi:MAG: VanZ family protein [Candidatus Omnitrophica bacterium]|nr:VanZ family protein [Candidatus Omnitrophota bacterium]MDD5238262.1 VanZ family protein [Candidatus Omnitrophota bacterium]
MYQRGRLILDWVITIIVYLLVLFIIPISDKLIPNLDDNAIEVILNWIINISIAAIFICLLIHLLRQGKQTEITSYVWLVFFFIISVYFLTHVGSTKDRLHFLGYGMLSLLLYMALRHNIATYMLYAWCTFLIIPFAILDESLQQFGVGGRGFEVKDIIIDSLSGASGQLLIALVVRPKLEKVNIKMHRYMNALKRQNDFQNSHTPKF